jgi:adenylate cyclase
LTFNALTVFPFDVTEDRVRFQQSVIDGENGYYDTVAKKFISQSVLYSLMNNVMPERDYCLTPDHERVSESINRIRRNLSVYQKNPSDSYAQIFLKYLSNRFLSSMPDLSIDAAILYVDIVGSTKIATKISPEDLSSLIRVFSQEMSTIISKNAGFVLKYAGDAVIAYFPSLQGLGNMTENAIRCGHSMNIIVKHAINVAIENFAIPPIQIRVSIDYGKNKIVFLGSEPDLIGHIITITSKMTPFAKPGQMVIGDGAYREISAGFATEFIRYNDKNTDWGYTSPETGKIYPIYLSKNGDA